MQNNLREKLSSTQYYKKEDKIKLSFGMFSPRFFDPFDRGYGYHSFNPWAYERPMYSRPQSAERSVLGSWNTPFWETPTYMEDQCEYPQRQKHYTPRRGRKTRPKSAQASSRKFNRPCCCVQDVHDSMHEKSDDQDIQDIESKLQKERNVDVIPPPDLELSDLRVHDTSEDEEQQQPEPQQTSHDQEMSKSEEELSDKECPQEPKAKKKVEEEVVEGTETVDKNDNDDGENDQNVDSSQPDAQEPEAAVPEQYVPEKKCDDESTTKTDDSTCTECNEQNDEKEKEVEEEKEKKESPEEIAKKKLEFIEEQLKKAREITPEEVLAKPIETDKQRLYLTEMLLRCILNLDSVQAEGNETVKSARKEAVKEIQSYLDHVEKT